MVGWCGTSLWSGSSGLNGGFGGRRCWVCLLASGWERLQVVVIIRIGKIYDGHHRALWWGGEGRLWEGRSGCNESRRRVRVGGSCCGCCHRRDGWLRGQAGANGGGGGGGGALGCQSRD